MLKAVELLKASLEPPRHELNELDWKAALSTDKKRLTEHLSEFANQSGGGFMLIQEALDTKRIKRADPDNRSRKSAEYVPVWA